MADVTQQILFVMGVRPEGAVRGLEQVGKKAQMVDEQMENAANSTRKLSTSSVNAAPAMLSLNQMLGDSQQFAFGFANGTRAIANNVEMATTQFVMLNRHTGGAVNTLKAMVGSLTGPMGILMAINAVMLVVVTFGDKIAASFNKGGTAVKDFEDRIEGALNKMVEIEGRLSGEKIQFPTRGAALAGMSRVRGRISELQALIEPGGENELAFFRTRAAADQDPLKIAKAWGRYREEIERNIIVNEKLVSDIDEQIIALQDEARYAKEAAASNLELSKAHDEVSRSLERQAATAEKMERFAGHGTVPFMRGATPGQMGGAWRVGVAADARAGMLPLAQSFGMGPGGMQLRQATAPETINNATDSVQRLRGAYIALGAAAGNVMTALMQDADSVSEKMNNVAQAMIRALVQFATARIAMSSMAFGPAGLAIAGITAGGALLGGLFSNNAQTETRVQADTIIRSTDYRYAARSTFN